jgi:glycosyltransferase involved in cell wall biosynthesis
VSTARPALVVFSSLFPSAQEPLAGVFIRERMFRVGRELPITVISPQPWFPLQSLVRLFRAGYRPDRPRRETMSGIDVLRPRFLSVPGVLRRFDGLSMALGAWRTVRQLKSEGRADVIDAHFAYPDGYAASRLGRWLGLPFTVTLRGTEPRHAADAALRPRLVNALHAAARVFAVSGSLREFAIGLGASPERTQVVGNGVDLQEFRPIDRAEARAQLGLPTDAQVLVTVGGLVERKGFHRVIDCLPGLLAAHPQLHYLIVGGPGPEGNCSSMLRDRVEALGLAERVHFVGPLPPQELRLPLSAADVFVLASSNEGWANVLLEAMACGLPVVATDVGGSAEVVARDDLGIVVPFGDAAALQGALDRALRTGWDRGRIRAYAEENQWDRRVRALVEAFRRLAPAPAAAPAARQPVAEG